MTPLLERRNALLIAIRFVYLSICAWVIAAFLRPTAGIPPSIEQHPILAFCLVLLVTQLIVIMDVLISKKRIEIISSIYFGLVVGVLLGYLLVRVLDPVLERMLDDYFVRIIEMILFLAIPYACTSFLLQTKDDFRFVIPYVEFSRELKGNRPLVIDSSALIDGRIADLVDTRIVDSQLVVPQFVLRE